MKFILAGCCLIFCIVAKAQNVPGPFDGNAFTNLSEQRGKLLTLIPGLQSQVNTGLYYRDTNQIKSEIDFNNNNITFYQNQIDSASAGTKDSIPYYKFYITSFKQRNLQLSDELQLAINAGKSRAALEKTLDSARSALVNVEYKINELMIPKISQQNFMFWASIAFVVLMGVLLFTFYKVVQQDQKVRQSIFGSDSGIQFVTLFSIIIAIILFGLTGVLEAKELSALLGSVAGYILGKAKFSGPQNGNQPVEPANSTDIPAANQNMPPPNTEASLAEGKPE